MRLRNLFMILLLCMTVGLFAVSCSDGDDGPKGDPGEQGEKGDTPTVDTDAIVDKVLEELEETEDPATKDCTFTFNREREFNGGDSNEVICGNDRGNKAYGMGGNDIIRGAGDDDELYGQAGDDELYGGAGDDELDGGPGDDMLFGEDGKDTLTGGDGMDEVDGGPGDDTIIDSDGDFDIIEGGVDTDTLDYSGIKTNDPDASSPLTEEVLDVNQYLHVSLKDGESAIWNNESDPLSVAAPDFDQAELLDDISGIENVTGAAGLNHLEGDDKNNVLIIPTGAADAGQKIKGMGGHDIIDLGRDPATNDLVDGGAGSDTLVVGTTSITLSNTDNAAATIGVRGIENLAVRAGIMTTATLIGDAQANTLTGGGGPDSIDGRAGNDTINGGPGADTSLMGGDGADTFIIVKGEHGDTIADYSGRGNGEDGDKIILKGFSKDKGTISVDLDGGGNAEINISEGGATIVTLTGVDKKTEVIYEHMD